MPRTNIEDTALSVKIYTLLRPNSTNPALFNYLRPPPSQPEANGLSCLTRVYLSEGRSAQSHPAVERPHGEGSTLPFSHLSNPLSLALDAPDLKIKRDVRRKQRPISKEQSDANSHFLRRPPPQAIVPTILCDWSTVLRWHQIVATSIVSIPPKSSFLGERTRQS